MFGQELDSTVTACFLSIPLASLLWSMLSFTIALVSFCIQSSDVNGKVLLAVIFGIVGTPACAMLYFFRHIRKKPPHREMDADDKDIELDTIPCGRQEKSFWCWKGNGEDAV